MAAQSSVETPAKIHSGHTLSRTLEVAAGSAKGWRNEEESKLDGYYRKGLLAGANPAYKWITGEVRLHIGYDYRRLHELRRGSGRDSSQLVISGARSPGTMSDTSCDAIKMLVSVDSHLSANDRKIVRMVCDEGYWPSEAVRSVDPGYRDATVPRFREAMDALVLAFEAAKRTGCEFRLG